VRRRSAFLILVVLLFISAADAKTKNRKLFVNQSATRPQVAAGQPGTFEARVEDYLRQSGAEFHKVKANSWYLLVNGKEMGQIRIILGAGPSSIAMGAVVVPKRNLKLSTEALEKLMKLSYDLNYVRLHRFRRRPHRHSSTERSVAECSGVSDDSQHRHHRRGSCLRRDAPVSEYAITALAQNLSGLSINQNHSSSIGGHEHGNSCACFEMCDLDHLVSISFRDERVEHDVAKH